MIDLGDDRVTGRGPREKGGCASVSSNGLARDFCIYIS